MFLRGAAAATLEIGPVLTAVCGGYDTVGGETGETAGRELPAPPVGARFRLRDPVDPCDPTDAPLVVRFVPTAAPLVVPETVERAGAELEAVPGAGALTPGADATGAGAGRPVAVGAPGGGGD